MPKHMNVVLYLLAVSLMIFYGQKLISTLAGSGNTSPRTRAEDARMDENAYYSLREVAGVQLGHVVITYRVDEASGRCQPRFRNEACPNPEADPEQLKRQMDALQDELHQRIRLLGPCADMDNSGYVTTEEGSRFLDLFEFGHLAAQCYEKEAVEPAELAIAAGLEIEEAARNLQDYRELVVGCPADIREDFPLTGN